jgi:hypothetical protein
MLPIIFFVIGWTDLDKKKKRDHSGLSALIVERNMPGFASGTLKQKWGIRAGNTGFFSMNDVRVPLTNRLGEEGEGFKIAMFALEQGRYTVAAGATGLIGLVWIDKVCSGTWDPGGPSSPPAGQRDGAQMVLDYRLRACSGFFAGG